jgi:hypothetical protein
MSPNLDLKQGISSLEREGRERERETETERYRLGYAQTWNSRREFLIWKGRWRER